LSATYIERDVSSASSNTLLPTDLDGPTQPPAGSPNYFISIASNTLHFFKYHVDFSVPTNSTLTGPTNIATAAFNTLCATTQNCITQPSTTTKLDGLGDRLMHRMAYRNFGDHEALVLNHSV